MSTPSANATKVGLLGPNGRMGQWVTRLLQTEYADRAQLAHAAGRGVALEPLLQTDVVIDFSLPEAMGDLAQRATHATGPLPAFVVGSTGWTIDQRQVLENLAKKTPVLIASNFSAGVLVLTELLKMASPLLDRLGYTPVIVEAHHKHKKDAPSGTALSLQRAIAPAGPGNVQTHAVRAGEVIGDHEITFYSAGDRIQLGHFAQDRSIFARGAIDVALWLAGQRASQPGKLIGIDRYFEELKRTCSN